MNDIPTPTPRTDACAKNIDQSNFEDSWKDDFEEFAWVTADFARTLERELAAVTEQRDRMAEEADKWEQIAHDKLSEVCRQIEKTRVVTEQLTVAREELNTAREDQAYMHKDLTIAIEQRDRLADVMGEIAYQKLSDELDDHDYEQANWEAGWDYIINIARKSLQSLNPDHTVDANDMIADVKGGRNEISR